MALRMKSWHVREVLAELAWPGHDPRAVQAWAETGDVPAIQPNMDIPWLGHFAKVVSLQAIEPDSFQRGRALLEPIAREGRLAELSGDQLELLLQLRLAGRDQTGVEELLDHPTVRQAHRDAVRADLLNPRLFGDQKDQVSWQSAFNRALRSPGIAEVGLRPSPTQGAACAFDLLTTEATNPIHSDQCITVLMSCFRPGPELLTAVRSVIRQSWTNWELLIIDDASGPDHDDVLSSAARLDPRVRVIRKALNGGTYRARNTALRQAKGEFCTVVDSDDWIHPQALERHVEPLIAQPHLMGTMSRAIRVSEDLELNRPGTMARVASAASLMFRVEPVLTRIGFFDITSKGADTEFRKRLELALGTRVKQLPEVLSILRTGETLSAAEISRGWKHSARRSYRKMYEAWHEKILTSREDPFFDPEDGRRFPEPRRWAKPTTPLLAPPDRISVCIAGDWTDSTGAAAMLDTVRSSLERQQRVAIMHLDALRFMSRRDTPLVQDARDLIEGGDVEWIQPDDDVEVESVVVHDPAVLQYPPVVRRRLRVSTVFVDDVTSAAGDIKSPFYCAQDVTRRARDLFGVDPRWESYSADDTVDATNPQALGLQTPPLQAVTVLLTSGEVTSGRDLVVDVEGGARQYLAVQRIPMRSSADAEHHDEIVMVHRESSQQRLRPWLDRMTEDHSSATRWSLLEDVPDDVVLVVAIREGLVQLSSRLPIENSMKSEGTPTDLTLCDVPPSWASFSWWASAFPASIHLQS